ncbi:MAG TPA: glutamine-hydrolyzing carbamoyl-phosphate synthase small subunit [Thermoplasmata archaeon]|nr:glutamine-hydrolyzing carbamoyl-phosphate synthase small subunit [Thermoplasmata archaeon]
MARVGFLTPADADSTGSALGGTLFLEDGTRFDGRGIGAPGTRVGEVVFTTGMVGYPESLTDPSYRGQILAFTYPLLGNYGVPDPKARDRFGLPAHFESPELQVRATVMRGVTRPNHWASGGRLEDWLRGEEVPGVVGIDTRRLTEHLRSVGVLRGIVWAGPSGKAPEDAALRAAIESSPAYEDQAYMSEVSVHQPILYPGAGGPLVALLDCGVKASIIRALLDRKFSVLRLPYDQAVPERWEGRRVSGLLVGNGPGDPETLSATIEELRRPTTRALPTLGICLGHQLLSLARGGTTYKLKFGHRGQNKTICFDDGRAMIVSENHGYAVRSESLKAGGLRPWATNPDDQTLEGIRDARGRVLGLQGHPEGHPGPQEAGFVFDRFAERVRKEAP